MNTVSVIRVIVFACRISNLKIRKNALWPIPFFINVFTALKGSQF